MAIKSKGFHLMLFTNPNIAPEYITVMLIGNSIFDIHDNFQINDIMAFG